ncbi:MAG: hypothetical protein ONB31_06735 [candidate division KSB1 bacterium]|nr:hypothetical protein [candidate division KSB1 bacterium]MDZ7333818.1 hypothetical protein [candidate division KSB1 bacterium]MDZ7356061.1 hypothetical protein [candidate division KSB1 bacterium]MDZ7400578.1 hypothetical protein [candidate division KSB1 bacterium]
MPGIVVIIQKQPNERGAQLLTTMINSMMHEPFYVPAMGQNSELGWLAGSVGLEGSVSQKMPLTNERGDVVLFLAGECFVDEDCVTQLRQEGHVLQPTNADFLVHLYEDAGEDCLAQLNGWFCGVIFDKGQRKALIFNDRYGIHRLYCYEDKDGHYFASEAKALLSAFPALRSIDPKSVAEYLSYDCVLNDRTYFSQIKLLPSGSIWRFRDGQNERSLYFHIRQLEDQEPLPEKQFFTALKQTFARILPRYLTGPKLALALTGGLDTRMILSAIPEIPQNLIALTYGNAYRECIDVKLARAVANAMNLPHYTINLDHHFLTNYSAHAARAIYITDGLAHATNVEGIYLNHLARSFAPIKLTGKFGSQILGKVRRALRPRPIDPSLIHPDFQPFMELANDALLDYANQSHLSFILQCEIPWFWATATVTEISQVMVRSPFLDNELIELLYRAPRAGFDGAEFQIAMIQHCRPDLLRIRTNKGLGGQTSLLSGFLRASYKVRGLLDKSLCWDSLPNHLHHLVTRFDTAILKPLHLDRSIVGFEHFRQYGRWFRDELADQIKAILFDPRTLQRPYWNQQQVIRIINAHLAGRGRFLVELRKLLTLELIHRTLIEELSFQRLALKPPVLQF